MLFRSAVALVALIPFVVAAPAAGSSSSTSSSHSSSRKERVSLSEKYIVTLRSGADWNKHKTFVSGVHKRSLMKRQDNPYEGVTREYQMSEFYHGYSGHFDIDALAEIKANHDVEYIEPQQYYKSAVIREQPNVPSYGLAAISNKNSSGTSYFYDDSAGEGATIYVVDTGINLEHEDFEGRATWGHTVFEGSSQTDMEGHGTHVAGTAAGVTFGVAKAAKLVAVKLSEDNVEGWSTSATLAGINWAVNDILDRGVKNAVINLSIGGPFSPALNSMVNAAVRAGISVVVAAGNEAVDAETTSPASARAAITVGAVDENLQMANYSNFGAEVDIFAPGSNIVSALNTDNTGSQSLDGTSMAAPHVAGLLAYLRVLEDLDAEAAGDRLLQLAKRRQISGLPAGTVNLFAFNGCGSKAGSGGDDGEHGGGRHGSDGGDEGSGDQGGEDPGDSDSDGDGDSDGELPGGPPGSSHEDKPEE